MIVKRFKVELSDLLGRFAATDGNKNSSSATAPMTTREIIDAAQEVFLSKLDVNLVGSITHVAYVNVGSLGNEIGPIIGQVRSPYMGRGEAATPASGIVMTIPDAPVIPTFNTENKGGIVGRIRSLDTLCGKTKTFNQPNIDELDSLGLKQVDEGVDVIKIKLVPESNLEVNTLIRSETFVCENASVNAENSGLFTNINFDSLSINNGTDCPKLTEIFAKLKILRDSANDVVKKIDDINKDVPAHKNVVANSQLSRRLSSMGGSSGLHRTSTTARTIQRPKMMRRSMLAALPRTPISSNEPKSKDVSVIPKSTHIVPIINMDGSKLPVPATYHSVSSGALTLSRSPATRYDSPTHQSRARDVNTTRKPSLRSPSLSSLNLKTRSGSKETKKPIHALLQISKDTLALGNRKAY